MKQTGQYELTLFELMKSFWKKKYHFLLAGGITALLFMLYTLFCVTPLYKSRSMMYVNSTDISLSGAKLNISASDLSAAKSLVETYIVILETPETVSEVIKRSGVNYSYNELLRMTKADAVNGTEIFYIEVTSPSPQEAELLANTYAQVIPERIASIVDGSSARIVARGLQPTRKASPNLTKNMLIGFIFGVLGMGIISLIQVLSDDKIYDENYLMNTYQYPMLASIPDPTAAKTNGAKQTGKMEWRRKNG